MTGSSKQLTDAHRNEEAAAWAVRLEAADATEADWLAYEQWLSDPHNKRAMDAIDSALAIVDDHRDSFVAPVERARPNALIRPLVFGALAAAAAGFLLIQLQPSPTSSLSYAAPANAVRTVSLPDGSALTLNRGAVAQVAWSATLRRVTLARGEASFRVVHNDSAAFIVAVGDTLVRDVGTEFNVLQTRDGAVVTVREGEIELTHAAHAIRLSRGDQGAVAGARILSRQVNPDDAFAWRDGRLVYRDASLSDVVTDLNRYSPTPIQIGDARAAELRFSGVLVLDTPTAMTTRLEAFLPVRSEHNAGGIVIRSR